MKGGNNFAGLKGWYYSSIYKENDNTIFVYLSKTQKVLSEDENLKTEQQIADDSLPNLVEVLGINSIVSLVNDKKHDNKFKIVGGGNGYVKLESIGDIPFSVIEGELINDPEDYSIYSLSQPDKGMFDMGQCSMSAGYNNKATNGKATTFGYNNHAYGKFSFVEGRDNEAGYAAHAEGRENKAIGEMSHVEGLRNKVIDVAGHAEGADTIAGQKAHAEGSACEATGYASHAEGSSSKSLGQNSHAEGKGCEAQGNNSHAEGSGSKALDQAAHAEGVRTEAGYVSHSEGYETKANGRFSHAEGYDTYVGSEDKEPPSASNTDELGYAAHVEGQSTVAIGNSSHAEGLKTKTTSLGAHAEGGATLAKGNYSHSEGYRTITNNVAEHACGKYNISTQSSDSAEATHFSIGIGTSDTKRKNALEVKQNGDIYIEGVEGTIQDKLNNRNDSHILILDREKIRFSDDPDLVGENGEEHVFFDDEMKEMGLGFDIFRDIFNDNIYIVRFKTYISYDREGETIVEKNSAKNYLIEYEYTDDLTSSTNYKIYFGDFYVEYYDGFYIVKK